MDQQQWLYYPSCEIDLTEVFVSHKNAELSPDCEDRLVVTSTTDRTVSTPGALTHCNLCLKKNLPYVLEVCARKETCESQPYIYVGDGFNVGVPIADRVFFTSECWETKTYRFILEKDAELRVGVLLSHADVGHSYTLKSLFLRVAWDPAVGTNTILGDDVLKVSSNKYPDIRKNTIFGQDSMHCLDEGDENTAVGYEALSKLHCGENNTALGAGALKHTEHCEDNTALGVNTLSACGLSGNSNVAVGNYSLSSLTTGSYNTAIGHNAGSNHNYSNTTCIGYNTQVGNDNQIKLGDSNTTVVGSNFQITSDMRDKTEVRNTELGLNFIKQLRPVDYKYDFRETYRTPKPTLPGTTATEEEVKKYQEDLATWTEANKMSNIVPNGTNKRNRYHHGFIAQEVGALNVFGGYQDMLVTGGEDVKTLGYMEFVAPLTKAVQELAAENDALKIRLSNLETNMQVVLSKLT